MKRYTHLSLSRYLTELSSDKPVPGGGSVSAYVASLGIGLAEMVIRIGIKRVDPGEKTSVRKTLKMLGKMRRNAFEIVDLDPRVYEAVMKSYAKARGSSDEKKKARMIDDALENSFRLQADLALLVVMAREAVRSLDAIVKGSIKNDLRVSLAALDASFQGAMATAEINQVYFKDPDKKNRAGQALEELRRRFGGSDARRS